MDMAPVADVTIGRKDPTIRTRSAGSDPQAAASAVAAAWAGIDAGGVLPGAQTLPWPWVRDRRIRIRACRVRRRKIAALAKRDFVPFQTAIDAGAPAIMMAHIRVARVGQGARVREPPRV